MYRSIANLHSPEEVASDPRILCWVMFFPYIRIQTLVHFSVTYQNLNFHFLNAM